MSGQTPRFGFNFFDTQTTGALSDDGAKFTGEDRLSLDALLAAFEKHNHRVPAHQGEPTDVPTGALSEGDGTLEGGLTYFYVVSFIDSNGLETVAGPELSIATPALLDPPAAPTAIAGVDVGIDTGSLEPGLYYYALTAQRANEESLLGEPVNVTLTDDEHTVQLALPDLGDADAYQVWRMKDSDPSWTRIALITSDTCIDTGAIPPAEYGDPANIPPEVANTGASSYAITITLGSDDATVAQTARGWRLYRSTISGQYAATSLVHEVVEHEDETDATSPLVTTWYDDGDTPLTGSPKIVATALQIPPFTIEQNEPLPDSGAYPDNYLMLDGDGALYYNKDSTGVGWVSVATYGPTGPSGPAGASGPAGPSGASGPAGGEHLDYVIYQFPSGATSTSYSYQYLGETYNRYLLPGDAFVYEVYWTQAGTSIGLDFNLSNGPFSTLRDSTLTDANGLAAHPKTPITPLTWVERRFVFPTTWTSGAYISRFILAVDSPTVGTPVAWLRNARIQDANGNVKVWVIGKNLQGRLPLVGDGTSISSGYDTVRSQTMITGYVS